MNTKTVRGKKYLHRGGSYNKTIIQRIEAGSKKKICCHSIPVEKTFSIVVPDRLTTEKPGNEKSIKMPTNGHNKRKSQQRKCHIHYYFLIYHGVTRDIVRGKGTVSLISSAFVIHRIKRSIPSPKPPCGTEP